MGEEALMDQFITPVLLFCARHRIRRYESVRELLEEICGSLEDFGFVDVLGPNEIDSLAEEAIHGLMDIGMDLIPPLTFAQEQVLRDLLKQLGEA